MLKPPLRLATAEDFRGFFGGHEPPPVWLGITAEVDGESAGIGCTVWDADGRAWILFDRRPKATPLLMHRAARRMIAALQQAGEGAIYAHCDETVAGARLWLERLGFVRAPADLFHRPTWVHATP